MSRLAWCLAVSSLLALAACTSWPMGPDTEEGVRVCHVRQGPRLEARTITVRAAAVDEHLAHGDSLGSCAATVLCTPSPEQCGDQADNDCDGAVDEGCEEVCGDGLDNDGDGVIDDGCPQGLELCGDGLDNDGDGAVDEGCAEVCGDGLDNDGDGVIDDGCVCEAGTSADCYGGPAGTLGVGACQAGTQLCNATGTAYEACVGDVLPAAEVCGDGLDNDCDGVVDDGCPELCGDGLDNDGDGVIDDGCPEVCGDGLDNDGDGVVDDGCVCAPGSMQACYDGPITTVGVGACQAGTQLCNATGTGYQACVGDVVPAAEVCGDGLDNDCDGLVDNGCPELCGDGLDNDADGVVDDGCVCEPGSMQACYDGPITTVGVGACQAGTQLCNATGTGYEACVGDVLPAAEACGDGLDNDCDGVVDDGCPELCGDGLDNDGDGVVDDGCVCAPGSMQACYDGPITTVGVGACQAGTQLCNATGTGYQACVGDVVPAAEVCGDGLDNDCDGLVDNGCPEVCGDGLDNDGDGVVDDGCVCAPGSMQACYDGPLTTVGVGACQAGTQLCNATGTGYEACVGDVVPAAEVCGDGLDNDCDGVVDNGCPELCGDGMDNDADGVVDDGCVCEPGSMQACYDGPITTVGVGACQAGTQLCNATGTGYEACVGDVLPAAEVCGDGLDNDCDGVVDNGCPELCGDGLDNDADGVVDDGCVCAPGSMQACYDGPITTVGVGACQAGTQLCNATGTGYEACVGDVVPAAEVCGDGLDNDCDGVVDDGCPELCGDGLDNDGDGVVDDGCVCAPGSMQACYDGPITTVGVGACQAGTQLCNATGTGYEACVGDVVPAAEVCGDGLDNDCDGLVDNGCPELCGDGLDNDGDGVVDDGCVCEPGSMQACYDGPLTTVGVGACQAGTQRCNATGTGYEACVGDVLPAAEVCGDGLDNDCDGLVDNGCPELCGDGLDNDGDGVVDDGCVCEPGSMQACYDGPITTVGVGACVAGTQLCNATGTGYEACVGDVLPAAEVCGDGLDNDCDGLVDNGCPELCGDGLDNDGDGVVDDGCVCEPGSMQACYDGPPDTADLGTCATGTQRCNATGTGYEACVGDVVPAAEVCGDGLDNDCDGVVDNGCPELCDDGLDNDGDGVVDDGCVCAPGSMQACYDGPPGTADLGTCATGTQLCNATGTGYEACVGDVVPAAEVCGDGLDNDCDGVVDNGCPELCDDGLDNDGDGEVDESCLDVCGDGLDNDGDGVIDDGCTPFCLGADEDGDGIADHGCLAGRVWFDIDRDYAETMDEPGVANVVMRLHRWVGNTDVIIAITTTDEDGRYEFGSLVPGTYQLEIVPPLDWTVVPSELAPEDVDCDFDEILHTTPWFDLGVESRGDLDAGIIFDSHT